MGKIDLNSGAYDASEGAAIFNGGKAGIAENVTVTLERKKPDDKENAPDYKVIFTDSNGGSCNMPFWFVTEATNWNTVEELITKQGKVLKHMLHCALGPNAQLPVVDTAEQMLNESMKMLKGALAGMGQVRIFANYGTETHRKKYIQCRTWVPFMEVMSTPLENTVLKESDLDGMSRLVEDAEDEPENSGSGTTTDDDNW